MDADTKLLICAHVQAVSRHFQALRTSEAQFVQLVRHSIGAAAPDAEAIASFLRREEARKTLEQSYETALWTSSDAAKSVRLVCLATTFNVADAAARIARRPPSHDSCWWCWQSERGADRERFVLERDLYGEPTGAVLHPQCLWPWQTLRRISERGQQQ